MNIHYKIEKVPKGLGRCFRKSDLTPEKIAQRNKELDEPITLITFYDVTVTEKHVANKLQSKLNRLK